MSKIKIFFVILALLGALPAFGEDKGALPADGKAEWDVTEGSYCTIYTRPGADLAMIERKLKRRGFYLEGHMSKSYATDPKEKLAFRMDLIFRRVEEILNMYPRKINVAVYVYASPSEMKNAYFEIFRVREDVKSFYIHKNGAIYTDETDVSDSVLSHEMAHAISDHYFMVRPPDKVREILATYVDMHLDD